MNVSAPPLQGYGVVGDLETVALIGPQASVDFLCLPRFDSPSVFAALLDRNRGGHFRISPRPEGVTETKMYLPNTNILLSRFRLPGGIAEVSDFMAVGSEARHVLVRRAKAIHGDVPFEVECVPRFDYGGRSPSYTKLADGVWRIAVPGEEEFALILRSEIPLFPTDRGLIGQRVLKAGETAALTLEVASRVELSPTAQSDFIPESFKSTANFWREWLSQSRYRGRWREMVNRSALVLKLLTSATHGAIIAAPTFGLPEVIGGARNWDYRYTWVRDASLTAIALLRLGFRSEAEAFFRWIEERLGERPGDAPLRIMYRLDGAECPREEELSHLAGYGGSRPVRIGNGAAHQLQLDIYGELLEAMFTAVKEGLDLSPGLWRSTERLLNWLVGAWEQKDEGIWEVRGGKQDFLFSRLMCWTALDRGTKLVQAGYASIAASTWEQTAHLIRADIENHFWSSSRKAYVQTKGGVAVDASALMMPLVQYLSPIDTRWQQTLAAIEEELVEDSLVYRYLPEQAAADGLGSEEGTFCLCSFWYAEALSRGGDLEKARFYFEKMFTYSNRLGLFAEEIGPSGEMLGNFPQAFSHLALINAAIDLDARLDCAGIGV